MVRALVLLLFGTRWGWLVLGAITLAVGGYLFFSAQQLTFDQISGTITDYQEVTHNGLYDRNELKVAGDNRIFVLRKNDFHPALPDRVTEDGKVIVWSNTGTGTTTVYAITLYDENGENPQQYTTNYYDHPESYQGDNQRLGGVIAGLGVLALLNGLFWPLLPWGRKRDLPLSPQTYTGISGTASGSPYPPDRPR